MSLLGNDLWTKSFAGTLHDSCSNFQIMRFFIGENFGNCINISLGSLKQGGIFLAVHLLSIYSCKLDSHSMQINKHLVHFVLNWNNRNSYTWTLSVTQMELILKNHQQQSLIESSHSMCIENWWYFLCGYVKPSPFD